MHFLNPKMAAALLGVAIPVIIHFFIRARVQKQPFPSIFFLKETLQKKSSQIRFSQVLLLLVRMAVVFLLALAVMQPTADVSWKFASSFSPNASGVVLLDSSLSMRRKHKGATCFERQKKNALVFLERLGSRSRVTFFTTERNGRLVGRPFDFVSDERIGKLDEKLECGFERARILPVFRRARDLLERIPGEDHFIAVFSDFQQNGSRELIEMLENRKSGVPVLLFFPPEPFSRGENNLFVRDMSLPLFSFLESGTVPVNVDIAAHGESLSKGICALSVNHRLREEVMLSLDESGTHTRTLTTPRDLSRETLVTAVLSGDTFTADNRFTSIFRGPPRVRILVIRTDPRSARHVAAALDPFVRRGQKDQTPFEIRYAENAADLPALDDIHVVAVSDPGGLTGFALEQLEEYVRRGGALIAAFGNLESVDRYNRELLGEWNESTALLPGRLERIRELSSSAEQSLSLTPEGKRVFSLLKDPVHWQFVSTRQVLLYRDASGASSNTVLIRTREGIPFLVTKRFGEGRIAWFLSALHPPATSIVSEPLFVPLIHTLADILTRGRRFPIHHAAGARLDPGVAVNSPQFLDPSGSLLEPETDADGLPFIHAEKPGVYTLLSAKKEVRRFAVNTHPEESRLSYLDSESLASRRFFRVHAARNMEDAVDFLQSIAPSLSLWRPLLWSALLMLLVEILIIARLRP